MEVPIAKAGETVLVTDGAGQKRSGRLEQVTASGLELLQADGQRQRLVAADVVRVVRLDSNGDGMARGFWAGLFIGFFRVEPAVAMTTPGARSAICRRLSRPA